MVHFVGAGPGAEDLITVRGARLLEAADVIIYAGSLVNPALLHYAKDTCAIYNSAAMTLEEVLAVMEQAHSQGKNTVRLHTGEPSLYGAVREQMAALAQKGIPYDSCPGVSACFGAAAAMNLEYTLPQVAQSLIITRMEGRTEVPETEQIERMAAHRTSMAIYLSAGMLKKLQERLIAGGYPEDTPAAIVYKATWPEEKVCRCVLSRLAQVGAENGIRSTAVVLVGQAIAADLAVGADYERSQLYDPAFETGYRKKKERKDD
ncbi:MAG: precorrin-4 C(11)-methyltransferase [Lachnospiraceae bacterium]|nr:precorrin-4 C(11)-methyltransferase [Lachnospiraceae bacterium]